ncbi:unnamed protein product [Sphenostylis stenocarpa]|uniref:Uncharacterized protein n=1 Tax=Sphenostylis stenocarpa TaxID=92480 RepID=A0AA86SJZ6_9FABA|nr:unnamed protein product [Sphenostylis stenocarpa]
MSEKGGKGGSLLSKGGWVLSLLTHLTDVDARSLLGNYDGEVRFKEMSGVRISDLLDAKFGFAPTPFVDVFDMLSFDFAYCVHLAFINQQHLMGGLGSLKGKDDSATKSAKGRRVQFSKDGEKGDKVVNGGKSSQSKDSLSSEHRVDQKLPENIKCLMDCEAADVLQGIQDHMVMLSKDSTIKMPISFDKGLQYAKSNSKPLANFGLNDNEICMIGNVCPETTDEVFALLPSLKFESAVKVLEHTGCIKYGDSQPWRA